MHPVFRRRLSAGAVALWAALALAPSPAAAVEPDALPEPLWWRDRPLTSLARAPLAALDETGSFSLVSEWAPLYAGPDGARIEQSRRSLRIASPPGPWRAAAEGWGQGAVARGGESAWWVGAERPFTTGGAAAISRHGRALALAAAVSDAGAGAGVAAEARARLAPGLRAWLGVAHLHTTGRAHVRWEDIEVFAAGRWRDDEVRGALTLATRHGGEIALGGRLLDRRGEDGGGASGDLTPGSADRLEPRLTWRDGSLALGAPALGVRWRASLEIGEGEQDLRVQRGGAPYLDVLGPVSSALATASAEPLRAPIALRAWAGRWRGTGRGSLAMWPFDGLAGLTGTRRAAASSASLEHWGLSLERVPRAGTGVDGGLALWSLAPRASYESWQGSLFGLVRSDRSAGETALRSLMALGGRLGASLTMGGARYRLEVVQWVPLRAVRAAGASGASGGSGVPVPSTAAPDRGRESGGTILRLSVAPAR
jgi:hypothetical protein